MQKIVASFEEVEKYLMSEQGVEKLDKIFSDYIAIIEDKQNSIKSIRASRLSILEKERNDLKEFKWKGFVKDKVSAGNRIKEINKELLPVIESIQIITEEINSYQTAITNIEDAVNKISGIDDQDVIFNPNDFKYDRILNQIPNRDIAEKARELGILNEIAYRDLEIRESYKQMRKDGAKVKDAEKKLAEKYHIGESTIHGIINKGKLLEKESKKIN